MTYQPTYVEEATVSGAEIQQVVAALEPILKDVEIEKSIIACLSISILLQHPNITPDELQEGISRVSQNICAFLNELEVRSGNVPLGRMN